MFSSVCFVFPTVGVMMSPRARGKLIITALPERVKVCFGSNPTITCTYYTSLHQSPKVLWYFNDRPVFNETKNIEVNSSHYLEIKKENASYLTIRNITNSHGGWYFCAVIQDIPKLEKNLSNGAELIVGKYYKIL